MSEENVYEVTLTRTLTRIQRKRIKVKALSESDAHCKAEAGTQGRWKTLKAQDQIEVDLVERA